ncbi:hypothetical protein EVAR_9814_1 [Eumeta japonica]|uniref:Uncharacterized protein n=1 Tax=Eumeta variegata TaxID=151549 RepID=A0A4C1U5P7_EUMVA|nr:hypothetical protein EVAR_9814_1 [Eumeta japonica]
MSDLQLTNMATYQKNQDKIRSTQRAMERSMLRLRRVNRVRHTKIRDKTNVADALAHALKLKRRQKKKHRQTLRAMVRRHKGRRWQLARRGKQQRKVSGNGGGLHPKRAP